MVTIGHRYELSVTRVVDFGLFLDAAELGEVLLPRKFVPPGLGPGDWVEVFLYLDSEDRPVATTQIPKVEVGRFGYLRAVAVNRVGAFLDWGLDKDLLVPFAEQHRPMVVGRSYLVFVYVDWQDGRIVASSKVDRFVEDDADHAFRPGQPVELIIAGTTDLGYKAIIDHSHWGVLYRNEVFQRLRFGQRVSGFIKAVRGDAKIDLSLHSAPVSRDRDGQRILAYLDANGGFAPLHDRSAPAEIAALFGISKAAFKRAIGGLYKQRLIRIDKDGIRRVD